MQMFSCRVRSEIDEGVVAGRGRVVRLQMSFTLD